MADKTIQCRACQGAGTHKLVTAAGGPVEVRKRGTLGERARELRTITSADEVSVEALDPADVNRNITAGRLAYVQE